MTLTLNPKNRVVFGNKDENTAIGQQLRRTRNKYHRLKWHPLDASHLVRMDTVSTNRFINALGASFRVYLVIKCSVLRTQYHRLLFLGGLHQIESFGSEFLTNELSLDNIIITPRGDSCNVKTIGLAFSFVIL